MNKYHSARLAQKQSMHLGEGLRNLRANGSPQSLLWSYCGAISVLPLHPCQLEISSREDWNFPIKLLRTFLNIGKIKFSLILFQANYWVSFNI